MPVIVHRGQQRAQGQHRVALRLHCGVVAGQEIGRILQKAEEAETFDQLHAGAGLRLLRARALAHLLPAANHAAGFGPAHAEVHGNVQTAVVDPPDFLQDIETTGLEPPAETGERIDRRADLVLVSGVALGTGFQDNERIGCCRHGFRMAQCAEEGNGGAARPRRVGSESG